ncbi:MAG: hypothetical protein WD059_15710 [Balneolaceae bacterium]
MKSYKKISGTIALVMLLSLSSSNWNNTTADSLEKDIKSDSIELIFDDSTTQNFACGSESQLNLVLRDCTVTMKGDNYELEVTFYDVSWWTCTKLKIGTWWNNTF